LSICGGGSRGIIPSLVLLRLEQITGRHPTELFDLFIGTSTGAMISAVLNMPNPNRKSVKIDKNSDHGADDAFDGTRVVDKVMDVVHDGVVGGNNTTELDVPARSEPNRIENEEDTDVEPPWKYTAKDLLAVYIKEGPYVFQSSMWRKVTTINGLYGPMYYTKARDERFHAWMGETRLKDLLGDVVFTSYNMCTKSPAFFKSRKARLSSEDDHMLSDCIKAATSAPTIWEPHSIGDGLYMDALYGKNPSMFGLVEALYHYKVDLDDVVILSLGTGYSRKHLDSNKIVTTGPSFLIEVMNSTINAHTMSTTYMLQCLIRDRDRILDIDIPLPEEHMQITGVSKDHIDFLINATQEYLSEHEQELVDFARLLNEELNEDYNETTPTNIEKRTIDETTTERPYAH